MRNVWVVVGFLLALLLFPSVGFAREELILNGNQSIPIDKISCGFEGYDLDIHLGNLFKDKKGSLRITIHNYKQLVVNSEKKEFEFMIDHPTAGLVVFTDTKGMQYLVDQNPPKEKESRCLVHVEPEQNGSISFNFGCTGLVPPSAVQKTVTDRWKQPVGLQINGPWRCLPESR